MSAGPGPPPFEEKKPSFWRRPVPIWAFLLLVVVLFLLLFLPAFFAALPPSIQQPLVLTPDSRSITVTQGATLTANFTVANLNQTNTIPATATATLFFQNNSTLVPARDNITLIVYGVQTGNSFVASSDGKSVSFPPGGNILIVRVVAASISASGPYVVRVSLSD